MPALQQTQTKVDAPMLKGQPVTTHTHQLARRTDTQLDTNTCASNTHVHHKQAVHFVQVMQAAAAVCARIKSYAETLSLAHTDRQTHAHVHCANKHTRSC